MGNILLFTRTPNEPISKKVELSISGEGARAYYLTGFKQGNWQVRENGKAVCTVTVAEGSDLITFNAGCGRIELAPL